MQLIKKGTPTHQKTVTQNIPTPFRNLPEKPYREPQFIHPQYQRDPYWDDDLYDQEKLEFNHKFDESLKRTEDEDLITELCLSDKLRYALTDLWTFNLQLHPTST